MEAGTIVAQPATSAFLVLPPGLGEDAQGAASHSALTHTKLGVGQVPRVRTRPNSSVGNICFPSK